MGLVLGLGLMAALGGGAAACVCLGEARRLWERGYKVPAGCFAAGGVLCGALAAGGAWLAWGIADAFLL